MSGSLQIVQMYCLLVVVKKQFVQIQVASQQMQKMLITIHSISNIVSSAKKCLFLQVNSHSYYKFLKWHYFGLDSKTMALVSVRSGIKPLGDNRIESDASSETGLPWRPVCLCVCVYVRAHVPACPRECMRFIKRGYYSTGTCLSEILFHAVSKTIQALPGRKAKVTQLI